MYVYRMAAWAGYHHILSKFVNFRVAKMYGNNGTLYRDTKI